MASARPHTLLCCAQINALKLRNVALVFAIYEKKRSCALEVVLFAEWSVCACAWPHISQFVAVAADAAACRATTLQCVHLIMQLEDIASRLAKRLVFCAHVNERSRDDEGGGHSTAWSAVEWSLRRC